MVGSVSSARHTTKRHKTDQRPASILARGIHSQTEAEITGLRNLVSGVVHRLRATLAVASRTLSSLGDRNVVHDTADVEDVARPHGRTVPFT